MKFPISDFTKIRRMEAAMIHADEKTNVRDEGNGHTAHTYANAPNNIFSACTVVFFPSGLPSYPSNGASCVCLPAMLYFRCLWILCLKSETEKGNGTFTLLRCVSFRDMRGDRRMYGCMHGRMFCAPRTKASRHTEKHSVRTVPCCRGSQLNWLPFARLQQRRDLFCQTYVYT